MNSNFDIIIVGGGAFPAATAEVDEVTDGFTSRIVVSYGGAGFKDASLIESTTANTNFRIWLGNLFGSLNVAPQLAHVAVTGFTGASTTGFGVGTPIGASVSFRNTSPTDMELNILNGRFYLNFRAIVIINSTQDTYATFRANCSSGSLVVETGSYFQATKLPRTTSIGRYISWT